MPTMPQMKCRPYYREELALYYQALIRLQKQP
uniref:Uncharacterized protein n=1 Tax=Rhizophora mucronata TaxID=61149 RepID=A0A2P2R4P6_RHIMU